MPMKTSLFRFRFWMLWVAVLGLSATAGAFEFRALSWGGQIDGLFFEERGRRVEVRAGEADLSPRHPVSAREQLVLSRERSVDGRTVTVPVLTLPMPADMTRAILLLARSEANPDAVSGVWLNDSPGAFPNGSFVFHNLSRMPVAVRAEGTAHMVPVRGSWSRSFGAQARFGAVSAAIQDGEDVRAILNHRLRVHPEYRVIFLFRDGRPSAANSAQVDAPVEFLMLYDHVRRSGEGMGEQRITGAGAGGAR